jgi:hypothetical protein
MAVEEMVTTTDTSDAPYTFEMTDGPEGFGVRFKRDGEKLCGTMYSLTESIVASMPEEGRPTKGEFFTSLGKMCDEIDAAVAKGGGDGDEGGE